MTKLADVSSYSGTEGYPVIWESIISEHVWDIPEDCT